MTRSIRHCLSCCWLLLCLHAAPASARDFEIVALGVQGGLVDGDLSSWLLRWDGDKKYLALDAGSLLPGIDKALHQGAFASMDVPPGTDIGRAGYVLRDGIAAYLLSHAHLDHTAGLVAVSPDDRHKPIYGLPGTLEGVRQSYFNGIAWPNLADQGTPPAIGVYHYQPEPAEVPFAVAGSSLEATLYPLQHGSVISSMTLLRHQGDYLAYFGDTGPDALQHPAKLAAIWARLAPLVRAHALKALMIEVSFPNDVADDHLYGHLTPAWLIRELHRLADLSGGPESLRNLDVIITHIKPSLDPSRDPRKLVIEQLNAANDLGVKLRFPRQGEHFWLPD